MDSLTQFSLGAVVSVALLGRKIGPRKAALVGGALGTLPDLDVLIPFADPVDSFVYHRGWSHSVFVHALAAPVVGEGLLRLFRTLRDQRARVYWAVYLVFATHAMIDAMTIYGTRIFWPVYPDPVGIGSIFIIDPIYSLPLIALVIWALFKSTSSLRFRRATLGVLIVTSAYMAASIGLQQVVVARAKVQFDAAGLSPDRVLAIAAPLTTVVWKVVGLEEGRYHNLYLSLLDIGHVPPIHTHPRHPELAECLKSSDAYRKLDWFSRGFNRLETVGDQIVMSDLRMGLTPGYVFRFVIGELDGAGIIAVPPKRDLSTRAVEDGDLQWLADRFWGRPSIRASEASAESQPQQVEARVC